MVGFCLVLCGFFLWVVWFGLVGVFFVSCGQINWPGKSGQPPCFPVTMTRCSYSPLMDNFYKTKQDSSTVVNSNEKP